MKFLDFDYACNIDELQSHHENVAIGAEIYICMVTQLQNRKSKNGLKL